MITSLLCLLALCATDGVGAFTVSHGPPRRQQHATASATRRQAASGRPYEFALLFDCDGVILETEELHRRAYNTAFKEFNLTVNGEPVVWEVRVGASSFRPMRTDTERIRQVHPISVYEYSHQ